VSIHPEGSIDLKPTSNGLQTTAIFPRNNTTVDWATNKEYFWIIDTMSTGAEPDTEGLGDEKINNVYREGAIAGEGGETKRGLKSRHIQFL
jgi:hypothetical protein